jgi:oligopeptide/dipeptide ABC transporter ATP-binding protein
VTSNPRDRGQTLLEVQNLVQEFPLRSRGGAGNCVLRALAGVSFEIWQGETLGLVGESGSGKSTLARALMQAPKPTSGTVKFRGTDLTQLRGRKLVQHRRQMQLIFQDPFGSLDPTWRVSDIVEEPLVGYTADSRTSRRGKVARALDLVGLSVSVYGKRRPRELSGGQCQRVAIARALTADPALLVCDEAVSALDVLVQAQLLNLFRELGRELGLAYLFISHDLALVREVSDRVAVLHLGELCEVGPTASLYRAPLHPYTVQLLAYIPRRVRSTDGAALSGELPSSSLPPPSGCHFRTRCPRAQRRCAMERPPLSRHADEHFVACHFPQTIASG